jgi:hypothetical protein
MSFTLLHAKLINIWVRRFFKGGLKSSNKSYDIVSIMEMKAEDQVVLQRETGNKTYSRKALISKWHKRQVKNPDSQAMRPPKDYSRKQSVEWLLTVEPELRAGNCEEMASLAAHCAMTESLSHMRTSVQFGV